MLISPRAVRHHAVCFSLSCLALLNFAYLDRPATAEFPVEFPAGWQHSGSFEAQGAWYIAGEKASLSRQIAPQTIVELSLRLGFKRTTTLALEDTTGKALTLTLEAQDGSLRNAAEKTPLSDALVNIALKASGGKELFRDDYYIRPNPASYKGDERASLLARWDTLPPASRHELRLKIVTDAGDAGDTGDTGIWIDDRFVGKAPLGSLATLRLNLPEGSALGSIETQPLTADRRFVPLGLQGYAPRQDDTAGLPMPRGVLQKQDGVLFRVLGPHEVLDVSRSRWLDEKTGPGDYVDQQYTRSAFDRNPDNILLAVPNDDYARAHVLAVVDPDPAKTPTISLSLTRYGADNGDSGGRGDGIAYSTIRLERTRGKWPDGVRPIGTVRWKDGAGKEKTLPLLHVAIPLHCGEIPDVIDETGIVRGHSTQYLDLELTKELHPMRTKNYSSFSVKPLGKPSGVLVYGCTLERAPVKVRLQPRRTGNIFYRTERVGFDLQMQNREAQSFTGKLRWKLTDFYGKTTGGEREVRIAAQSEPVKLGIDLPQPDLGWYRAELSLVDAQGRAIWRQPTSLAILAPDTRRDGLESPFGAWWFRTSHGGTDSLDEIAPLFRRMGFRHTNPARLPEPDGAEWARHGMSLSTLPFVRKGALEQVLPQLDEWVARNPQVPRAMIFHESGSGAGWQFPPEFIGRDAPKMDEKQQAKYDAAVQRGIEYARYLRAKYPRLKLTVGNGPLPFIAALMQNGYPRELVDAWGDEEVGQANIPEAPPGSAQSDFFWIQEYSKKYGYDKPVTTAYEWRGRGTNPGNLTELKQAQFYTRDVLKALAFGVESINPGLIHDVGDTYYYSRWGAGGFLHRYPLLNPKISYVAMAVLTQQLDRAQLLRVLDTDSPTLHALEFKQGSDYVYTLWVPRGERKVNLTFNGAGAAKLTDMNGRSVNLPLRNRQATITVTASPLYLRVPVAIASLKSSATRTAAPTGISYVAAPMDDMARWELDREPDKVLETTHFDAPRRVGAITAQSVADPEKHAALELTLAPEPHVPWPMERYITLRPKRPIPLVGQPKTIGIWIKGNSCWGRVFFEIEDAKGEKFNSIGDEGGGWSLGDWEGETSINFDGWNYISVRLPQQYASGFYQPQQNNWRSSGGDGKVDFPVRVSKLVVTMRDKVVQLNRPVDVRNRSIRLYGLSSD